MLSVSNRAICLLSLLSLSACAGGTEETSPSYYPRPSSAGYIAPTPAEPSTRGEVQTAIYNWFLRAGYPPHHAAALVDHARVESGFNPCIRGPGGVRYIYQWNGTRLQRLHEFAGTRTCPPLTKQLEFAHNELRSNPNYSCFLSAGSRQEAAAALLRGFGRGRC